jgi:hypothetical protein
MVRVRTSDGGTTVRQCCELCQKSLRLDDAWLAFRPGAYDEPGQWVHQRCSAGSLERLIGEPRAVLMRGRDALISMVTQLEAPA